MKNRKIRPEIKLRLEFDRQRLLTKSTKDQKILLEIKPKLGRN